MLNVNHRRALRTNSSTVISLSAARTTKLASTSPRLYEVLGVRASLTLSGISGT